MTNVVHLAASLRASPSDVFDMYLDARQHAEITGAPAKIAATTGAEFAAFDGALTGKILQVVKGRLIVQSWRASGWKTGDIDSTLILTLLPKGRGGTLIRLVQVNVPDHDFAGVSQGWELYYWAPWRKYLESRRPLRTRGARSAAK
jgi:activator of HSP90 ATPase